MRGGGAAGPRFGLPSQLSVLAVVAGRTQLLAASECRYDYQCEYSESDLVGTADAIALSGLRDLGYRYLNLDGS
jgi:hypothetical protein